MQPPSAGLDEAPVVVEIAERAVDVLDVDQLVRVQRDPGAEALLEHLEADDQVGVELVAVAPRDPRGAAPGQELRIALDRGDEVEQLLLAVRQVALLGMGRHGRGYSAAVASALWRAARRRSKSSPA